MEENNHREHAYPRVRAWRVIVGILIVLAAFSAGFMCGRISGFFGDYGYGYGYRMGPWMMYGGYGYPYGGYAGYGGYAAPESQAVPSNATATPVPYYYPMWRMMGGYYYPAATGTQ